MPEPEQVVDLIPDALCWRLLRKYASSSPGVGSQLSPTRGSTGRQDAACTVAQKLARCPLVEHVLWAQEAANWLRDVWLPGIALPSRGGVPNVHREHPALVRAVFHFRWSFRSAEAWARRAQGWPEFREQWCLIVLELSACWHHPEAGAAFREWIEGDTMPAPSILTDRPGQR
jgi:hypothetical protein